jgi:hypothetical protein
LCNLCFKKSKKNEYKRQVGKIAERSKAAQAVGQTRPDGA